MLDFLASVVVGVCIALASHLIYSVPIINIGIGFITWFAVYCLVSVELVDARGPDKG